MIDMFRNTQFFTLNH